MINRHQLQYHVQTLQNRSAAMTALFMTIFLLCIEHVRSFANQYHISAHDAMVLASAANGLRRKLSATYLVSPDTLMKKSASFSFFTSHGRKTDASSETSRSSATKLNAWSMNSIASMSSIAIPTMPTSKDIPFHTLGSWYTSVDPTMKPPVYDDEYDNSYSFRSPTDDWPSMSSPEVDETVQSQMKSHLKRGPLKTIRRVAGKFKDIIVQ